MGKNSRKSSRRPVSARQSPPTESGIFKLLALLLWSLFFARWFIPTEGSSAGDTIWLTALTFPAAALWFWAQSRQTVPRIVPGLMDAVVWSLAGAHILAALLVIFGEGEKRLALNMMWEWSALAVLISTLRQTLLSEAAKDRFHQTFLTLGITLAVLGIWQHYIWYPGNRIDYDTRRSELEQLDSAESLSLSERQRQRDLQTQFLHDNIPLSGPQRDLFERRLRDSTEPLGFFALANSFAAILAMVTVLLTAGLISALADALQNAPGSSPAQETGPENRAGPVRHFSIRDWTQSNALQLAYLAVVGFSLLLTKSRTAFAGTAAGIGFLVLVTLSQRSRDFRKRLFAVSMIAILLTGLLVVGAVATESLDIEVLSEAPKSLQYRFLYWEGTAGVIADSPWFGTGPGNFRSHYLRYKLPETSEEIADPHNLLFDVMASAGLPGLLALLFLVAVFARNLRALILTGQLKAATQASSGDGEQFGLPPSAAVIATATAIVAGWQFAVEALLDPRILSTGLLAVLISLLSRPIQPATKPGISRIAVSAAVVSLLVHLLAAGGIAMPAICSCLFALMLLTETQPGLPAPGKTSQQTSGFRAPAMAIALVTAFGLCLQTSFLPVLRARSEIQSGDHEVTLSSRLDRARSHYQLAAEADPFSPAALMRLSGLAFALWEQNGQDEDFTEGVQLALEASRRNPHSGIYQYQTGIRYRQRFEQTKNQDFAIEAASRLERALTSYPTHPLWNAEYTLALADAGLRDQARRAARKTLRLETINREAGHLDRFLPDSILKTVRELAEIRTQTGTSILSEPASSS